MDFGGPGRQKDTGKKTGKKERKNPFVQEEDSDSGSTFRAIKPLDQQARRGIGRDDLVPDMDARPSVERRPIKGAVPTLEDIEAEHKETSSTDDKFPLAKYDPIRPSKRGARKGNDPDPDNFSPPNNHGNEYD